MIGNRFSSSIRLNLTENGRCMFHNSRNRTKPGHKERRKQKAPQHLTQSNQPEDVKQKIKIRNEIQRKGIITSNNITKKGTKK